MKVYISFYIQHSITCLNHLNPGIGPSLITLLLLVSRLSGQFRSGGDYFLRGPRHCTVPFGVGYAFIVIPIWISKVRSTHPGVPFKLEKSVHKLSILNFLVHTIFFHGVITVRNSRLLSFLELHLSFIQADTVTVAKDINVPATSRSGPIILHHKTPSKPIICTIY